MPTASRGQMFVTKRDNHYEAAFEAFLRDRRVPYVAIDESKRALAEDASLKSLDFIVYSSSCPTWLVDVKGRRFPSGRQKRYWKNWSTRDDLRSLARWEEIFGDCFQGLFVFAYEIQGDLAPLPQEQLFDHQDGLYGFVAVPLREYTAYARMISPKWDTVAVPTGLFRRMAEPFETLL